jgi:hypothetical protein
LVLVEETLSWLVFIICFLSFPEPSPLFLSKGRGGGEGYILPLFYFVYPAWPAEPGPPLRGGGERIKSAGPLFLSKGARVNNIVMTLYLLIVYLFYFYDKKQKVNTYSYFSCRSVNKK